jgi:hypothetical protein
VGELEGNQGSVGDFARNIRVVLGAALLSVVLAACGGGGDSPTAAVESSSANPGDSSGSSSPGAASFASAANSGAAGGDGSRVPGGHGAVDDDGAVTGDAGAGARVVSAPGAVTLSWMPPTMTEDDGPLTLSGYRIYWGLVEGYYPYSVTLSNPGLSRYVVDQLAPATWYFVATALSDGGESEFSNSIALQVP